MSAKYIRTKVDNNIIILSLKHCNFCPFLYFNNDKKITTCLKFKCYKEGKITHNIIDALVFGYRCTKNILVPLKKIVIPEWCGLSDNLSNIDDNVYYKTGNNTFKTINVENLINNNYLKFDDQIQFDHDLITLISKSEICTGIITTNTTTSNTEYKKCNCCGEYKKIDNKKHDFNICDDCYNKIINNKYSNYLLFINKFRLKRKSTWLDSVKIEIDNLSIKDFQF